MSDVTRAPGMVVWRELMTTDVNKARGFYGELFGWKYEEFDMGGGGEKYPMIKAGESSIGGVAKVQAGAPHWVSYVSVLDVDKSCAAAKARGGKVAWGPTDIPGVGRMATIVDSAGASIAVMRGESGDGAMPQQPPHVGTFCWETLSTNDVEKAKDFYGAVCAWKPVAGPDPKMVVFGTESGTQVADVQLAHGGMPPSFLTYVVVDKHDTAREKAVRLGARVVVPRIDVPKIGTIAVIADPQGAVIGLFEAAPMS